MPTGFPRRRLFFLPKFAALQFWLRFCFSFFYILKILSSILLLLLFFNSSCLCRRAFLVVGFFSSKIFCLAVLLKFCYARIFFHIFFINFHLFFPILPFFLTVFCRSFFVFLSELRCVKPHFKSLSIEISLSPPLFPNERLRIQK